MKENFMADRKRQQRKRTLEDRLITGWNSVRFAIMEPIQLRLARARFEHEYDDPKEEAPLVSVYIPTYNRGQLLIERSVTSVLSQSYKHFELIIVGDHCTDNTEKLVSQIGDPRIRFINLPSRKHRYPDEIEIHWLAGGVVPAKKALELVHGKWIARVDDDDIWTNNHLEALLRFAQQGNFEFVSAHYEEERFGKRKVKDAPRARDEYFTQRKTPPNDLSPKLGAPSTFFYRSYLRFVKYNINCWRKSWNRDNNIDLSLRMYYAGVRIGYLDQVVTYILPRPGEQTVGLDAYQLAASEKSAHFRFGE
jgi:glycosyltransferase involved in cell wall biosynthesis